MLRDSSCFLLFQPTGQSESMGCESAAEQTSVSLWEESGGGSGGVGASDGGWVWLMGREWVGRC